MLRNPATALARNKKEGVVASWRWSNRRVSNAAACAPPPPFGGRGCGGCAPPRPALGETSGWTSLDHDAVKGIKIGSLQLYILWGAGASRQEEFLPLQLQQVGLERGRRQGSKAESGRWLRVRIDLVIRVLGESYLGRQILDEEGKIQSNGIDIILELCVGNIPNDGEQVDKIQIGTKPFRRLGMLLILHVNHHSIILTIHGPHVCTLNHPVHYMPCPTLSSVRNPQDNNRKCQLRSRSRRAPCQPAKKDTAIKRCMQLSCVES